MMRSRPISPKYRPIAAKSFMSPPPIPPFEIRPQIRKKTKPKAIPIRPKISVSAMLFFSARISQRMPRQRTPSTVSTTAFGIFFTRKSVMAAHQTPYHSSRFCTAALAGTARFPQRISSVTVMPAHSTAEQQSSSLFRLNASAGGSSFSSI